MNYPINCQNNTKYKRKIVTRKQQTQTVWRDKELSKKWKAGCVGQFAVRSALHYHEDYSLTYAHEMITTDTLKNF